MRVTVQPGDLVRRDQVVAVVEPAADRAADPATDQDSGTAPDAPAAHPAASGVTSDTRGAP
ncbi:hypothetical protein [Cellulosimicrobium sp. CUA-896]|uniref:hypothetical protein n=1 Tax=Cellulosimicrobium sp. CUA-896 TaxID=1517881 RepID=UPI000964DFBA|nr:hypothetical protein BJF88_13255 [Cellulosimicrobium sp. CUA-896]